METYKRKTKKDLASDPLLPSLQSCDSPDIQAVFKDLTLHAVSLHDESGQQEDIAEFVASFVRTDRKVRRWQDEDKDLVIKILSEKADGM